MSNFYNDTDDQSQKDTDAGMIARIFANPGEYINDLTALAQTGKL
jgi:hypothetical protein